MWRTQTELGQLLSCVSCRRAAQARARVSRCRCPASTDSQQKSTRTCFTRQAAETCAHRSTARLTAPKHVGALRVAVSRRNPRGVAVQLCPEWPRRRHSNGEACTAAVNAQCGDGRRLRVGSAMGDSPERRPCDWPPEAAPPAEHEVRAAAQARRPRPPASRSGAVVRRWPRAAPSRGPRAAELVLCSSEHTIEAPTDGVTHRRGGLTLGAVRPRTQGSGQRSDSPGWRRASPGGGRCGSDPRRRRRATPRPVA